MEFVKAMKIRKKICKSFSCCDGCPLRDVDGTGIDCCEFMSDFPETTEKLFEQWDKENPERTYKDVFMEKLPKALQFEGHPVTCVEDVFGKCPLEKCEEKCGDCWNSPYEEENQ